ncbi:L-ectoine synthase [Spongiactinospora gelatinilytica]|uniref:L-ectoine synthase n=1 Tax=Spongiactinospora gelatinilytica TaxID=2666298 RepID=A0A2W2GAY1_9ACTN|nr:ectoine synthase [Spongiactinospora gelatinilytica]PZG31347.1 L-ectoine synthase [Spongiactinospora gelatinilytica]
MIFRNIADIQHTERDVHHEYYRSTRLLLAGDGAGVGLTDTTLHPGVKGTYGYSDRTEIAYCVSGAATAVDLETGQGHAIAPGVLWVAPPGSRFTLTVTEPTRLICVFDPPIEGTETGVLDQ